MSPAAASSAALPATSASNLTASIVESRFKYNESRLDGFALAEFKFGGGAKLQTGVRAEYTKSKQKIRQDLTEAEEEKASANEAVLTEAAGLAPRVDVADFSDVFCTDDLCKPVIGNVVVYSDNHHLTDTFARTMIPRLRAAVDDALATR